MNRAIENGTDVYANYEVERKGNYKCPFCNKEVIIKKGVKKIPHFAHKEKTSCKYTEYYKEKCGSGNIENHTKYEYKVKEYFEAQKGVDSVSLEVKIGNRIADVVVYYKNGRRGVFEVQLSYIPLDKLIERSNDYISSNISKHDITWLLGAKNYSISNGNECSYCDGLKFLPYTDALKLQYELINKEEIEKEKLRRWEIKAKYRENIINKYNDTYESYDYLDYLLRHFLKIYTEKDLERIMDLRTEEMGNFADILDNFAFGFLKFENNKITKEE